MSLGGSRVSSMAWSPLTDSSVSVWTTGASSPTEGIGSALAVDTCTWLVAPENLPSAPLVADSTAYWPRLGKSTSAA